MLSCRAASHAAAFVVAPLETKKNKARWAQVCYILLARVTYVKMNTFIYQKKKKMNTFMGVILDLKVPAGKKISWSKLKFNR